MKGLDNIMSGYGNSWQTPPQPAKSGSSKLGLIIAVGAAVWFLVVGTVMGALTGWPTLGLWLAGFAPVVLGVVQLVKLRLRGFATIGVGLLAGVIALATFPTGAGSVAEPAPVTSTSASDRPVGTPADDESPVPSSAAPETSSVPTPTPTPTPTPPASSSPPTSTRPAAPATKTSTSAPPQKRLSTAQQVVAGLVVKGRGPKTGYDRDLFSWNGYDFDRNGCDQRNDVLQRDMHKPVIKPGSNGCRVEAGWLQDRYGGTAIYLPRAKVDIDHVVALSNAWQMGAAQWPELKRKQFANDPLNLVATTQHWNRQKGDSNAASWLPPKNRCSYIARQAVVKQKYGLAITVAERDAMNRVLADCPNQALPTGSEPAPRQKSSSSPAPTTPAAPKTTPPPAPKTTPPPAPKTTQPPAPKTDPQFRTCGEAKKHGYGPYVKGKDPEYGWYQDRDKDGVVCE